MPSDILEIIESKKITKILVKIDIIICIILQILVLFHLECNCK